MKNSITDSVFYHIYPLGLCGCPQKNDFACPAGSGIRRLAEDLPRLSDLGINSIYIGPLFESSGHGYDTVDYFYVDRRLGNNEDFAFFVQKCHEKNISVIVDAVFNHTGRDFFAFKDLIKNGANSIFKDWYANLDFSKSSCYGDCFNYEGWAGCMDLVKFNLDNPDVKNHIFAAVEHWIKDFGIDGLRLDAADVMSKNFLDQLRYFCQEQKKDFFLVGEVVHGNYCDWVSESRLHSVTNYELYKGMWSSFNDSNFYEVAYSLNRQFGSGGIYENFLLYSFLDNHDVNRIASVLKNLNNLNSLYTLLFCVPGIPSIYYGSELGICGSRSHCSDEELRPSLPPFSQNISSFAEPKINSESLLNHIKKLISIRKEQDALKTGTYTEIFLSHCQFAFMRKVENKKIIALFNSEDKNVCINIKDSCQKELNCHSSCVDLLTGEIFNSENFSSIHMHKNSSRILLFKN